MIESRLFHQEPTDHERGAQRRANQRAQGAFPLDVDEPAPARCPACGGGPEKPCSCSTTGAEALELQ